MLTSITKDEIINNLIHQNNKLTEKIQNQVDVVDEAIKIYDMHYSIDIVTENQSLKNTVELYSSRIKRDKLKIKDLECKVSTLEFIKLSYAKLFRTLNIMVPTFTEESGVTKMERKPKYKLGLLKDIRV